MRCHLSILGEVCLSLITDFSYSAGCTCVGSFIFAFLAISCGPPPQGQYHVPESAIQAAERNEPERTKQNQQIRLPESAMVRLEEKPYLRNAFKETPRVGSRGGLDDFYATTRGRVQNLAVVSDCSLDVLKAFIAKGWPPIVMIQFQGRSPEILMLSGYNDQLSEVSLQNPTNFSKRRLSYTDFEASWSKRSRNKCILITAQQLSKIDVHNVLRRYLPTEAFQGTNVRSR